MDGWCLVIRQGSEPKLFVQESSVTVCLGGSIRHCGLFGAIFTLLRRRVSRSVSRCLWLLPRLLRLLSYVSAVIFLLPFNCLNILDCGPQLVVGSAADYIMSCFLEA